MLYYLLQREGGTLYSMNLMLSEEEARQYGQEGEMVPVKALVVWTDVGKLENFRIFLSVEQEKSHSPFAELIRSMRDEKVDVVELDHVGMRGNLRRSPHDAPFLLLNPGPEQQVLRVEELLAQMSDETPKITGAPRSDFKMYELEQAVGKTIAAVEYGPVEGLPGWAHIGEAIVIHFTDNTALSLEIGSNAGNLASEHPNLEPEDFHTDLIPLWRDRDRPK